MPFAFRSRRIALALLPALALFVAACDSGDDPSGNSAEVTVMSRNLYLGADLFVLLQAQTPQEVPGLVAQLYGAVLATDYPTRAGALAAEIEANDPDLIGLQEVSLYRRQTTSDYITGTTTPNATEVTFDFLQILRDSLAARGLDYTVAATNTNADVELPGTLDGVSFFDLRLTDRDVILARSDVQTSGAESARFLIAADVPVGGSTIAFVRGYSLVTASVDDVTFTFANSHLEVGGAAVQAQILQATSLHTALDRLTGPVVLVGDFNSDPTEAGNDGESYRVLTASGRAFTDVWADLRSGDPGPTCCHAADLRNPTPTLDERIDLILTRGTVESESVAIVGDEAADRTASGLAARPCGRRRHAHRFGLTVRTDSSQPTRPSDAALWVGLAVLILVTRGVGGFTAIRHGSSVLVPLFILAGVYLAAALAGVAYRLHHARRS